MVIIDCEANLELLEARRERIAIMEVEGVSPEEIAKVIAEYYGEDLAE